MRKPAGWKNRYRPSAARGLFRRLAVLGAILVTAANLTACGAGGADSADGTNGTNGTQNSPYLSGEEKTNTLFTAFVERSPKYLDPTSSYSTDETAYTYQIYEPLFAYHYLKRPYELIPRSAAAIPQPVYLDASGKTLPEDAPLDAIAQSVYDIPIKRGIRFQPHPAFARDGRGNHLYHHLSAADVADKWAITDFSATGTRELTADDFVYGLKRLATPRVVSPIYPHISEYIVGLRDYGDLVRAEDRKLRANLPVTQQDLPFLDLRQWSLAGVEALDRYTLRIRVKGKYPQFKYWLAMTFMSPIPWEAEKFYSQPGMAAKNLSLNYWPVGTGPYMLTEYRQNRRHVLTRNPNFRGEPYPCEGEPQDMEQGLLDDCGRMTPFIDRIVFSVEKEAVPLSNKFLQGYYDIPEAQRGDYGLSIAIAMADSEKKREEYTRKKIRIPMTVETGIWYMGFNWLDPVIGKGDTPEQQARNRKLRQAISIAMDMEEYITIFEDSLAIPAYGPVPPGLFGYVDGPEGVNPVVYDLADGKPKRKSIDVAKRLLAEAGYPDGRDARTGRPLVINFDYQRALSPAVRSMMDWYSKQFARLGIQLEIRATDYNRFQDKMRRGSQQLFLWGWNADYPDAENFLFLLYGPHAKAKVDGENAANYQNDEYDRLFERMKFLDDGPEKAAIVRRMIDIVREDAPWIFMYFPMSSGTYHQWVGNGKPTQMIRNHLQYMKVDPELRARMQREWNDPVWWPVWLIAVLLVLAVVPAWLGWRRRERATATAYRKKTAAAAETTGVRGA